MNDEEIDSFKSSYPDFDWAWIDRASRIQQRWTVLEEAFLNRDTKAFLGELPGLPDSELRHLGDRLADWITQMGDRANTLEDAWSNMEDLAGEPSGTFEKLRHQTAPKFVEALIKSEIAAENFCDRPGFDKMVSGIDPKNFTFRYVFPGSLEPALLERILPLVRAGAYVDLEAWLPLAMELDDQEIFLNLLKTASPEQAGRLWATTLFGAHGKTFAYLIDQGFSPDVHSDRLFETAMQFEENQIQIIQILISQRPDLVKAYKVTKLAYSDGLPWKIESLRLLKKAGAELPPPTELSALIPYGEEVFLEYAALYRELGTNFALDDEFPPEENLILIVHSEIFNHNIEEEDGEAVNDEIEPWGYLKALVSLGVPLEPLLLSPSLKLIPLAKMKALAAEAVRYKERLLPKKNTEAMEAEDFLL